MAKHLLDLGDIVAVFKDHVHILKMINIATGGAFLKIEGSDNLAKLRDALNAAYPIGNAHRALAASGAAFANIQQIVDGLAVQDLKESAKETLRHISGICEQYQKIANDNLKPKQEPL